MRLKCLALLTILVCLVLYTPGCGSNLYSYSNVSGPDKNYQHYKEIPVYIDKNFEEAELEAILRATSEWNYVLNGHIKLVIKSTDINIKEARVRGLIAQIRTTDEGYMILKLNHNDPLLDDIIEEDDGTLAFVNNLGNRGHVMVVIADRIGGKDLRSIVLHEYGHLLGAMHVMARSLMFPYYNGRSSYRCVDKITMLQVANYQQLDPDHLNYCITPNLE
jgi:hypothetical protein